MPILLPRETTQTVQRPRRSRVPGPVPGFLPQWTPESVSTVFWWFSTRNIVGLANGASCTALSGMFYNRTQCAASGAGGSATTISTYNTNVANGKPSISLPGSAANNYMTMGPVRTFGTAAWHIFLVAKTPASGNMGTIIAGGASSLQFECAPQMYVVKSAVAVEAGPANTTPSASTVYLFEASYDGTTYNFYLNGTGDGTVNHAGDNFSVTNNWMFRNSDTNNPFKGDFFELVVASAVLSGDDLTNMRAYLKGLYGL